MPITGRSCFYGKLEKHLRDHFSVMTPSGLMKQKWATAEFMILPMTSNGGIYKHRSLWHTLEMTFHGKICWMKHFAHKTKRL